MAFSSNFPFENGVTMATSEPLNIIMASISGVKDFALSSLKKGRTPWRINAGFDR
jgi:hypothetical protein